jgi:hypothetical protein
MITMSNTKKRRLYLKGTTPIAICHTKKVAIIQDMSVFSAKKIMILFLTFLGDGFLAPMIVIVTLSTALQFLPFSHPGEILLS